MKVSDFIVKFLIEKRITDVFGYPGGMVTHLMDSFRKHSDDISTHLMYHEQGAAFAACGYAQASGRTGFAYATSGPGATNLITGICHAFFDSIPVIFVTGQVNTFESSEGMQLRQKGFQETDIVSMVKKVTKYVKRITDANSISYEFEKAYQIANAGRKGPVLLDIPMNILRAEFDFKSFITTNTDADKSSKISVEAVTKVVNVLEKAERPVILLGNGIKQSQTIECVNALIDKYKCPVVTSMISIDALIDANMNYGFVGAYGERVANIIVAKCDLLLVLGARLDVRQVGADRKIFAPNARIIRVDIDESELAYAIRPDDIQVNMDLREFLPRLSATINEHSYTDWLSVCDIIKNKLLGVDELLPNKYVKEMSSYFTDNSIVTTDVGQNQVWVAQSLICKKSQRILFSGGHGAMGFSLPAAIGACFSNGDIIYSFNGDGGIQMNIQELQVICREQLPIKIIILNNHSLGMIRHFQEMYFNSEYAHTTVDTGYTVPDFEAIAKAYKLPYVKIKDFTDIQKRHFEGNYPTVIEVELPDKTYICPKLKFGQPNQEQDPPLDSVLLNYLMDL